MQAKLLVLQKGGQEPENSPRTEGLVSPPLRFLRYPGGKQRLLRHLIPMLPNGSQISGQYIEPFVGSASIFLAINPQRAILSDANAELIDLYRGLRDHPTRVWNIYASFPGTKKAYYRVRGSDWRERDLPYRAARLLYLNRTCFKGMWRQNSNGEFNIGYGGQERRWAISRANLTEVSSRLKKAIIVHGDFENTLDYCGEGDFAFCDPPYRPSKREVIHSHYTGVPFTYADQERLAKALRRASRRGILWALTNSSHPDVLSLYRGLRIDPLPEGTGALPGILTHRPGEVLIRNYSISQISSTFI